MDVPSTTSSPLVPDPGLTIRRWVAQLLRVGVGLSLLNVGLAGYMALQGPTGGGFGGGYGTVGVLTPFLSSLPYLAIGLGLALVLGFLTTVTSIAVMIFCMLVPLFFGIMIVTSSNPMRFGPPGEMTMMSLIIGALYLPSLVPQLALVWLSALENHPYSVDALIFGRSGVSFEVPEPIGPVLSTSGSIVGGVPAVGEPAPEVRGPGDVPFVDLQR